MAGEGAKRPDSRGLAFFDITDFSPGIYSASVIASGSAPNNVPGIFPAPPGAADQTNTFGCLSEPNGGLGPGPSINSNFSITSMGITGLTAPIDVSALTNSMQSTSDELVIGLTTFTPSAQTTNLYSWVSATNSVNDIPYSGSTFNYDPTLGYGKNFISFPYTTTITNSGIEQPVVVIPITAPSGPTSALLVYPSIATPGTFSTDQIASTCGSSIGHQGRIVAFQPNNGYGWPVTINVFPNEGISYTDPPQTETWPHQFETFGPEDPFGYGAVGSQSAGELFAIKCRRGAIIIQGDLNNPTVTQLPGVQSTGPFYGQTDSDQNGLYYCSNEQGGWIWNGSNASTKISTQLDDNFFIVANPILETHYYGYYCQRWGDWMLFSNNWIFNSTTGGWWRLVDPNSKSFYWSVPAYDPAFMFFAQATISDDSEHWLYRYDRSTPNSSYVWQSLPIRLPTEDRLSDIRELVIRASNAYGDAGPSITPSIVDSFGNTTTLDTWTMTPGINTIQETRLNVGVKSETVAVVLNANGATAAPVVHSLAIGYRPREHTALA